NPASATCSDAMGVNFERCESRHRVRAPACSVNVPYVLIETVKAEGFSRSGMVASAFGNMQIAGVFEGRDDGGPDGGQVDRPAASRARGCIVSESDVTRVRMRVGGRVLADQAGQVLRGGVSAGQAGDGVDGLARGLAGGGGLPPAGDLDGLAGPG